MLESGLDIAPSLPHRFSWRDYEKGFEVMRSGAGKGDLIGAMQVEMVSYD